MLSLVTPREFHISDLEQGPFHDKLIHWPQGCHDNVGLCILQGPSMAIDGAE